MPDNSRHPATALLLLFLSQWGTLTTAATGGQAESPAGSPQLSRAFLEYLGSFEDDDGKWLDPMTLEQVDENNSGELPKVGDEPSKMTTRAGKAPAENSHE